MNQLQTVWMQGKAIVDRTNQRRKMMELIGLIDDLAGEMGSSEFVMNARMYGYNIEADVSTLERRGIYVDLRA